MSRNQSKFTFQQGNRDTVFIHTPPSLPLLDGSRCCTCTCPCRQKQSLHRQASAAVTSIYFIFHLSRFCRVVFFFFFQPETNHKPDKYRSEFRVHPPLLRPFWHRHLPSVFYLTCNRLLGVIKPQEGTTWTSVDLQLRGLLPFQWPHSIRGQNLFPDKQTLVKSVPVKTVMEDQHVQI